MSNNKYIVSPGGKELTWKRHTIAELQKMTLEERYWHYVIKGDDEDMCWLWMGMITSKRYGAIKDKGKRKTASRVSYELHNNTTIPSGMFVCHTCDNPPCTNPKHLFLGTVKDNVHDSMTKGRFNKAFGENAGRAKLNNASVIEIFQSNTCPKELAKKFNVEIKAITRIRSGESWSRLTSTL